MVDMTRVRRLNEYPVRNGKVIYWMSRDQRVEDNWALLYAQQLAIEKKVGLVVVFCEVSEFLGAQTRQFEWMRRNLRQVERGLRRKNIPFRRVVGNPVREVTKVVRELEAGAVVCDFSPLRLGREWREGLSRTLKTTVFEVDAHNIVPVWVCSGKQEYSAATIRYKIYRFLPKYLVPIPLVERHVLNKSDDFVQSDWAGPIRFVSAQRRMRDFLRTGLSLYSERRNDPNTEGQSGLSTYLHFGSLGAQRLALETLKAGGVSIERWVSGHDLGKKARGVDEFLEELVVRRELSENFCFYNPLYDELEGLPEWGKRTLKKHQGDKREYVYSRRKFEEAATHDQLWNAAQRQVVREGRMHGYMRMYWAKKILEWSRDPGEAIRIAVYLNDKYEMDGRDPNGYAGILWAIGGLHDRPWKERKVYGTVRYMNEAGCRRKFDVQSYMDRYRE